MNDSSQTLSTQAPPSNNADARAIDNEKKISQLEHDIFLISKQLEETRDALKDSNNQTVTFKNQVESLEAEKVDRAKLIETLEKSRNDLITERTQLQDEKIRLQSQKDAFENDTAKLLHETRRLAEELSASKSECAKQCKEKCLLQIRIDEFEGEKNIIAYEKERWSREKEILMQGKQWCMNEISNRETKLNEMRIEMMKLEAKTTREKYSMVEERDSLSIRVDELSESLAKKDQELAEMRDRLQKIVVERTTTLNEMDSELRTKERLSELYKSSLDAANSEIASLKASETTLQALLQDNEISIVNATAELEKLSADHEKDILAKDSLIKSLNDELAKANELLRLGSRVHRSDDEIAALSPSAAAASNLIRSGISLTSIYAEHCRVVAELEKKTADNERIERYVTDLIQELDEKAPMFKEQREFYENSLEEINRLRHQNELLSEDWHKIQNERDSIVRELSFTKAELERYQHEHQALSLQVRRLLFNIERSNGDEPHFDAEAEQFLFSNISELQQNNLDLLSRVKKLEAEKVEATRNAHDTEIEALKVALQSAEKELERIRETQSKTDLVITELTLQRDNYKSLYEDNGQLRNVSPPGSGVPSSDKSGSDVQYLRSRAEFLQTKLEDFAENKRESDRALNDRIDQQIEQISQLRTTNGKLESALEFQKKNQQLLNKSTDELNKELKKANDTIGKLSVRVEALQSQNDDLTNKLLNQQQEISQLRVSNHSLEEHLQITRNNEHRANMDLAVLRETSFNAERVALTLEGVETILKRVDTEKQTSFSSQLQSAYIERDNLKTLLDNVNRQHSETTNKLKAAINELKSERDNSLFEAKTLRENLSGVENRLKILKEEYEKLTSESLSSKVADDDIDGYKKEIQQLKNKCAYQEKQIAELEAKSEELSSAVDAKENELQRICSLSGNMENVIKDQKDYVELEQARLQAICNKHEESLRERKEQIEQLRNTVSNLELQLLEKGRALEFANSRFHDTESKFQLKCNELEITENTSKELYEQLQQVVDKLQSDYANQKAEFVSSVEEKRSVEETLAKERLNSEQLLLTINNLNTDIAKLKSSVDILKQEKLHLLQKIDENSKRDNEHLDKIKVLYDEIHELTKRIACMEQVQMASGDVSTVSFDDANQAEKFSTIIGYMRTEKTKEIELRMNAEMELTRLRSQASIDQNKIGSLEAELSQAKIIAETNSQAAREKNELLNKINAFREAQQRYVALKTDFENLTKQYETTSKTCSQMDASLKQLQREKVMAERLNASLKATIEQKKVEFTELRERHTKAMELASKYSPESYSSLLGEFEEKKRQVSDKDKEIELLKDQLQRSTDDLQSKSAELEEKLSNFERLEKMLSQTRILARRIRDDKTALEKEVPALKAQLQTVKSQYAALIASKSDEKTAEGSSSWSNVRTESSATALLKEKIAELQRLATQNKELTSKIAALEKENADLVAELSKVKEDLNEANEKCFRLDMITSSLNQTRKRYEELQETIKQKDAVIEELKRSEQSGAQSPSRKRIYSDFPPSSSTVDLGGDKRSKIDTAPISSVSDVSSELQNAEQMILDDNVVGDRDIDVEEMNNKEIEAMLEATDREMLAATDNELLANAAAAVAAADTSSPAAAPVSEEFVEGEVNVQNEPAEFEEEDEDEEEFLDEAEGDEEEDEYMDEEMPGEDDDDGDDGPPDENAGQYSTSQHNNSDEIICLDDDEEGEGGDNNLSFEKEDNLAPSSLNTFLGEQQSQPETNILAAATASLDESGHSVRLHSPSLQDKNMEEEEE